jgi:hypothetical protein
MSSENSIGARIMAKIPAMHPTSGLSPAGLSYQRIPYSAMGI